MLMAQEEEIKKRIKSLGLSFSDFRESFLKSSGPGGQNVNKTSTAVVVQHLSSGLLVKCQKERSQSANRLEAWILLLEKIKAKKEQERLKAISLREKVKRQNRKRPQSLKEKILEQKRHVSEKKKSRHKISSLDQYI